ncbi:hypothetical protein G9A89_002694 [Geosiphon pyriformis]|nr:hypothetical protein G9A89_002694 [Geosiphon pyriformis]
MNIKHYITKQFPQVQQPVESDPEEYKYRSNNPTTAQDKFTVNKKPRVLFPTTSLYHQTPQKEYGLLFGNLTPTLNKTDRNTSTWEPPPTQSLTESSIIISEKTAILQPIGKINKGKQPELAPEEHSSMQTPNPPALINHEAVITYLRRFNQIFRQILAIKRDYYTTAQVLNQFIKGLRNSILRSIRLYHLTNLQDAVTLTCDFESAEQEPELQEPINHHNGEKITTTNTYSNRTVSNSNNLKELIPTTKEDHGPKSKKPIPATKISTKHNILISHISKSTAPIHTTSSVYSTTTPKLLSTTTNDTSNLPLSNFLLQWRNSNNNQTQTSSGPSRPIPHGSLPISVSQKTRVLINLYLWKKEINIPPVTITEDTTLATIFLFDIDNLNTHSLFSEAVINQNKPIMALYTNVRVRGINIKLILDNRSASSIITKQFIDHTATINGIQIPTKVLIMEATQYQALVGNDWLQHAQVLAMCEHFKTQCTEELLIEFEDIPLPPTIETYQVS